MSDRIDVTFGWIVLRDVRTVKDRERKEVLKFAASLSQDDMDNMARKRGDMLFASHDFENVFAATMIKEWSFDEPVSPEGLADLPWVTRNEITEIVAPMWKELFPSFDPDPSEESPTVPSDA